MWESIWNSNNIYYVMGIVAVVGVICKVVGQTTLRRLVKAASNMAKSTHKFMKLVRAKYEHACMVNEQVDNVNIFLDGVSRRYNLLLRRYTGSILVEMWCGSSAYGIDG